MGDQDFEGLDDLWTAIKNSATSGHSGANADRIFDGCIFVTQKEWDAISTAPASRTWDDMTAVEKLSSRPIRILANGKSEQLLDGRVLVAFADTLYLLPKEQPLIPPLPRLYIDGCYVSG